MTNQFKTVFFLGLLTGLLMAVGYWLGGNNGALTALGISALMNLGTYWFSDKMVLAMYQAKEVKENEYPELHRIVRRLAQHAHIPMPRLYIVNMPVPNAFATGRNPKHAAVAVSPSIMELLSERELTGVLAHELSHVKNRDILISTIAATIAGALSYLVQMSFIFGMGGRDGEDRNPVAGILLLILSPLIASLLHLAVSRSREYLADESGAHMANDPEGLASALEKSEGVKHSHPLIGSPSQEAAAHLFIVNPFKGAGIMHLFSSHPPMEERIKRLRAMRV